MSNKVIIITRSTAYTEYMPDFQKIFYTSINNQSECKYNNNNKLKNFLAAREKWKLKRAFSDSDIGAYRNLFNEMPENLGISDSAIEEIPTKAIQRLMNDDVADSFTIKPYASFTNNNNKEVVLVLTDRINIIRDELMSPFELFIDSIFKDVLLDDDEVILFVHDAQIDKFGDSEKLDIRDFIKDKTLTDRIKKFYCFAHFSESPSIFQDIILNLPLS